MDNTQPVIYMEKSKRLERTVKEKRVLNTTSVKDGYDRKREQEVKRKEGVNLQLIRG